MPETSPDPERAAPIELRVLPRPDGKANVHVYRGADALFPGRVDIAAAGSRQRFVRDLKRACPELTEAEFVSVAQQLDRIAAERAAQPVKSAHAEPTPASQDQLVRRRDDQADGLLAEAPADVVAETGEMLGAPDLLDKVMADVASLGVVGERETALTVYLLGTSRLLDRPLAAVVQGGSSTGKSYVVEQVARLFPDECVVRATDMTPQALYYGPEDGLVHRLVVAGERRRGDPDEQADTTRGLREMISSGVLHKVVTERVEGRNVTRRVVRYGPIAFVESTTAATLFEEDANRRLLLATDERAEQTAAVNKARARRAAGLPSTDVHRLIERHHALQRALQRVIVVIPFAEQLADRIPCERPEARRALDIALSLVSAVTLLYQRQRGEPGLQHGDTIRAVPRDYRLAYPLLVGPLGRALGGDLPAAVERFGVRVHAEWPGRQVTAAEIAEHDPSVKSVSKVREYLRVLDDHGHVETDPGHGREPNRYRIVRAPPEGGATWLPHPDDVDPPAAGVVVPCPPSRPDGAAGRQAASDGDVHEWGASSAACAAPAPPERHGAASAAAVGAAPRRTDPPRDPGGGKVATDPLLFPSPGMVGSAAPPPHEDEDRDVLDRFPGASRIAGPDVRVDAEAHP